MMSIRYRRRATRIINDQPTSYEYADSPIVPTSGSPSPQGLGRSSKITGASRCPPSKFHITRVWKAESSGMNQRRPISMRSRRQPIGARRAKNVCHARVGVCPGFSLQSRQKKSRSRRTREKTIPKATCAAEHSSAYLLAPPMRNRRAIRTRPRRYFAPADVLVRTRVNFHVWKKYSHVNE